MTILHITTFLQGGAGRIIAALAVAQRAAGHDVTVVLDAGDVPGYGSYPEYVGTLRASGVAVVPVRSTFTRDVAGNVAAAAAVRSVMRTAEVDVLHTHAAIPTLVALLARTRRDCPVLQTMHGWGVRKTAEQAATDLHLLALADGVVTPSHAAGDGLRALGLAVPVEVIPYGLPAAGVTDPVDADDRAALAALRASGRRIALCVGTLGERKQQTLLVEALSACPDVAAVFIGEGEVEALRQHACRVGVGERTLVLGYRVAASRYLAEADVLVLPSRNEGLPIAVLEALRAGVPVVGSAIPEIAEALDESSACLFTPGDASALAAALLTATDPSGREARRVAARAVFAARFDQARMVSAYERRYRAAIALAGRR